MTNCTTLGGRVTCTSQCNALSKRSRQHCQAPDCSGIFEATTGAYTDTIQTESSVLETTWSLTDPTNLIFKLDSFKELTAN